MLHPDRRNVTIEVTAGLLFDLAAAAGGYTHSAGKFIDKQRAVNEANSILDTIWNPHHEQLAKCADCKHHYERHFDSYEDMEPVGCKYCGCRTFVED